MITNMSCEQLANEAGISTPLPAPRQQQIEKASPVARMPPAQAQSSGFHPDPVAKDSPLHVILKGLLPLFLSFGSLAILLTWLKHRARKALYRRSSSRAPLTREAIEPTLAALPPPEEVLPYRQTPVMSRYELELFNRLKVALPECEIFPQVPLASFIQIDKHRAGRAYYLHSNRWQNRISQQRVDFLACRRQDMSIVSAIELDDPTHHSPEATQRDEKKNKSLKDANIPLIRWRVETMPDPEQIRQELLRRGLIC